MDATLSLCHWRFQVYPAGKRQAPKVAVHSLTFAVHEGECFGFLGTNGAGKTTTLSMISGMDYDTVWITINFTEASYY